MNSLLNTKVSVVIPSYNGGTRFRQVIESILSQRHPFDLDIVIIDSSSNDGTAEYLKEISQNQGKINLISIPKSEFQHGKTRNLAIAKSKGDFVALLTQDAMPANENWLTRLITPMLTNSEIAGVFGSHLPYADADIFEKKSLVDHFNQFGEGLVLFRLDESNKKKFEEEASYRGWLCFYSDNNSALRRSVWEKLPYPEVAFAEDQLWAYQIIKEGYVKAYHSEAIVYHSHRFSFKDYYNRCKEEGEALYAIYGWKICSQYSLILKQILYFVKKDFSFLRKNNSGIVYMIYWMNYSLIKNTSKVLGFFEGYKKAIRQKA